jgi:thymidylate kinase
MIADGLDFEREIHKFVDEGGYFIADRHTTFSAFVYQTEDFPESTVAAMFSLFQWRKPDLAILVDAPVEVAMQRQRSRQGKAPDVVWEKDDIEYNMRLREKYLALFARYEGNGVVLDGTKTPDELTKEALALLGF